MAAAAAAVILLRALSDANRALSLIILPGFAFAQDQASIFREQEYGASQIAMVAEPPAMEHIVRENPEIGPNLHAE